MARPVSTTRGEQSRLLTHISATESVTLCRPVK